MSFVSKGSIGRFFDISTHACKGVRDGVASNMHVSDLGFRHFHRNDFLQTDDSNDAPGPNFTNSRDLIEPSGETLSLFGHGRVLANRGWLRYGLAVCVQLYIILPHWITAAATVQW